MSDPVRVPPVVEAVIRTVVGGSEHDRDERASTFARGLALGALVGAAIAGSTIWQRRLAQRRHHEPPIEIPVPAAGHDPTATETEPSAGIAP